MSDKHKHCKGCKTNEEFSSVATCMIYNKDGKCPCSSCIVKMMDVCFCDKYNRWENIKLKDKELSHTI